MAALVHFDSQGRWGETLVCERSIRAVLEPLGVAWGRVPALQLVTHRLVTPGASARLLYFRHGAGHVGVLCEPGEWLALPQQGAAAIGRPRALPTQEAFVSELLSLLGEDLADAAD
jgi:hypothetical protein